MKSDKNIGIFYPAAFPQKEKIKAGLSQIKQHFSKTVAFDEPLKPYRYLARKPEDILNEFLKLIQIDELDYLIAARGGAGSLFLVNQLKRSNLNLPLKIPILIGFSDLTALFWYLWKEKNISSIYGPSVAWHFACFGEWKTFSQFEELINGKNHLNLPDFGQPEVLFKGEVPDTKKGIILPVCLSVFAECVEAIRTEGEYILILEDLNENAYKIERYMNILEYKGVLRNTSVIVLGDFLNMDKPEWLNNIMIEFAQKFNISLISGINFGHHLNSISLPFGKKGSFCFSKMQLEWSGF